MCLSKVDKKPRQYKRKIGYKVMRQTPERRLCTADRGLTLETGVWLEDTNQKTLYTLENVAYPSGFHIFTNKKMAERYCTTHELIRKCCFDNVVATGTQRMFETGAKVVVARKIKILEENNDS